MWRESDSRLEELRASCRWIEYSYSEEEMPPVCLCRHPSNRTGVCSLENCPRRE